MLSHARLADGKLPCKIRGVCSHGWASGKADNFGSVWYPSYPLFLSSDLRLALYAALAGERARCTF